MKGRLLLAEAATGHPDGTISMLRAGINQLWVQQPPYQFQGTLVVRVEGEAGDASPSHSLDLRCMDDDGTEVIPQIQGQFGVPKGGGINNVILQFATMFPKPGKYTFVLRVNNVLLDTYSLTVSQGPPPSGKKP